MELNIVMEAAADSQSGTETPQQAKILVVDDDALNQRMMQVLLTREGYHVDVVSSGAEAIEAVKLQQYDIVFMDLQMPVMDGVETSRRIRTWENGGRHTFIIALTASYLPEQGQELFEAGIDNYISKPFELEHIQRLLKYSLMPQAVNLNPQPATKQDFSSLAVLDIQKGVEQVGGDTRTYRELLSAFVQQLPERLQAMQLFFAQNDLISLSRAAHNLNGIAANLGALQMSEWARVLDKQSVEGYTEVIHHLMGDIRLTGDKLITASNDFLADDKAKVKSL
ncbi:MAG TPA: response regulator [Anaerolineales bacterium]|nr:response regulator [Anaerolineales bacterium]